MDTDLDPRAPEPGAALAFEPVFTDPAFDGYTVRLARRGLALRVEPGASLLAVVRAAGVPVESSCERGICGACETRVLAGRPDHRDQLLSPEERARGDALLICCSGSLDDELVLDL